MDTNRFFVLILTAIIMSTCYSECKCQNSNKNNFIESDTIRKDFRINKITKIENGYIIVAENSELKYKIVSSQSSSLIKFRKDFNIKNNRDTIQIGKIYRFKLVKLFASISDRPTVFIYNDCTLPLSIGTIYYTTDCLDGLEIVNEICK